MSKETQTYSDYLFAQATDETRRLKRQSQFFSHFTSHLLDSAGITAGMKVLDVGTGIGDVAFMVAERVGPQGAVVGVDMNPAMVDFARQRAQAAGITNVSFVQADLSQVVPDDQFDAVVGRAFLMYIKDRVALLRRLSQRLRPGGILAFQELDLTLAGTTLSPTPLFEQAGNRLTEVFQRAGLDTQGLNLFHVFLEAGLPAPEMDLMNTVGGGPEWAGYEQIVDVTVALLPLIIQFGIATREEVQIETLLQRLREEAATRQSAVMAHGLMNVWTRVA
ncbi:MAG TPA: class I SAM-dependent methyltransferase [Ktedonobacterales bacterium]